MSRVYGQTKSFRRDRSSENHAWLQFTSETCFAHCRSYRSVIRAGNVANSLFREVGERADLLGSCYLECLKKAVEAGARTIAFCCISTGKYGKCNYFRSFEGVFGYPQEPAAKVALETVKKWLEEGENAKAVDLIVFNVWTAKDLEIYTKMGPIVFK